ncbi:MAG: hypothetical protein EXR95_03530 [Gemmatimonadetes bacterium]|nr:hypothetical protein [Gemmatimonadota bacterium]
MEIMIYPNSSRPGVGLKPRKEAARPLLPQHARHCPVLEAASGLGFLVYPPLEKNEAFQVTYEGDGRFLFSYFMTGPDGKWQKFFTVLTVLPVGSIGMMKQEVEFALPGLPIDSDGAIRMASAFVVAHDLGTPPGAITLRGATNFRTPPGWDTVYGPVVNQIDRPVAPMLVVRVETDWYVHESEFRYVLQPGEGVSGSHTMPIGQVYFVPREDMTLKEATEAQVAELHSSRDEFLREKAATKLTTRYGLQYSPHYARESRARRSPGAAGSAGSGDDAPEE